MAKKIIVLIIVFFCINIYLIMRVFTFISTLSIGFIFKTKSYLIPAFINLGLLLAVLSRIFFDIYKDSTLHNLFPIEVMITLMIVFPTSIIGMAISNFIKRTKS